MLCEVKHNYPIDFVWLALIEYPMIALLETVSNNLFYGFFFVKAYT